MSDIVRWLSNKVTTGLILMTRKSNLKIIAVNQITNINPVSCSTRMCLIYQSIKKISEILTMEYDICESK